MVDYFDAITLGIKIDSGANGEVIFD